MIGTLITLAILAGIIASFCNVLYFVLGIAQLLTIATIANGVLGVILTIIFVSILVGVKEQCKDQDK